MSIQASFILNQFRINVKEPNPSGRWSDADALTLANQAIMELALDMDWPESTIITTTASGQAEYNLPEMVGILRVYVAGQLLYPTDIPALQGEPVEQFDQSATDNSLRPLWVQQQAAGATFPVQNDQANPVPGGLPYYLGQRPVFYVRGGNIGLVPAPLGPYTMQIDCIPIPVQLTSDTTVSDMPQIAVGAIAWKMAAYAHHADDDDAGESKALARYEQELRKVLHWRANFVRSKRRVAKPYPYRVLFNPLNWSIS